MEIRTLNTLCQSTVEFYDHLNDIKLTYRSEHAESTGFIMRMRSAVRGAQRVECGQRCAADMASANAPASGDEHEEKPQVRIQFSST